MLRKILIISCAVLFVTACENKENKTVKTVTVSFKKEGELVVKHRDSVLARLDIELADDDYKTQTGLMYRQSMEDNQAMLFVFPDERPRSFYMKNTEFSIDIIYMNARREVVSIQKNARPFDERSLPSGQPAQYVLEVNAGLSDRWGLQPGDTMEW